MLSEDGMEKYMARFKTQEVVDVRAFLLDVTAGNLDHGEGEPVTIVFVELKNDILPMSLTLRDSRQLVVGLLNSLYTADDEFAAKVLESMFPSDHRGKFCWPDATE